MRIPVLIPIVVLLAAGCTSRALRYAEARGEFDSITGYGAGPEEPDGLTFRARADRWPWTVRLWRGSGFDWLLAQTFSLAPVPNDIDNPSEFARDRLGWMAAAAEDRLGELADMGVRALWLVAYDPQPLDQIVAIGCFETVLTQLGVDPLAIRTPARAGESEALAVDADLRTLDRIAPWARGGEAPRALERAFAEAAVRRSTAHAASSASTGRRLLRYFLRAAVDEQDPELRRIFERGLVDTLANESALALRVRLAVARDEEVRIQALHALVRLSGPRAVAWSLAALARFQTSERFRREWVRLCATLPVALVDVGHPGGPTPLEFLYDVVKNDPDEGLRSLGLEALALCLGRDIDHDPAWADVWWNQRVLDRGVGR